jgi:hypothetical protein
MKRLCCFAAVGLLIAAQNQYTAKAEDAVSKKPKKSDQIGLFYQPNNADAGTGVFRPGNVVISRPALWGLSAQPTSRAIVKTSAGDIAIETGTIMPATLVSGMPGSASDTLVYCTVSEAPERVVATGLLGMLSSKILDSLTDGQKCLMDKDDDGRADHAFLLNAGSREDRLPRAIEPQELNVAELREAGAGDLVSITLTKSKNIEFVIDIEHRGESMKFDSIIGPKNKVKYTKRVSVGKNQTFPINFSVYGAKFQILAFDPQTRSATIEFGGQNRDDLIEVPTKTVVRVRYY